MSSNNSISNTTDSSTILDSTGADENGVVFFTPEPFYLKTCAMHYIST